MVANVRNDALEVVSPQPGLWSADSFNDTCRPNADDGRHQHSSGEGEPGWRRRDPVGESST